MLHREFWTGHKRGEGVKFGGGRECLCYQWENSQPLLCLMNEFSEWTLSSSVCALSCPSVFGTTRRTYRGFLSVCVGWHVVELIWFVALEHCGKHARTTCNRDKAPCPPAWTHVHVCWCWYKWLIFCLYVCALCAVNQLFCSNRRKHFSLLAFAQTKQKNNFFMIQPCCYCPSSLVTKLSLSFSQLILMGFSWVKYSPVIHIHSAQGPCSDVPRCLL